MFKKIKQNRMSEDVVNQVLETIARGDLAPDDKLPSEMELAEIFGVSRITIREAIRSLEQLGVIVVKQGSRGGAYVKKMDHNAVVNQIGNVLKMANVTFPHLALARACLEREILTALIPGKITPEDCDRLYRNIEEAEEFYKNRNSLERLHTNFGFHTELAKITQNPVMILMHRVIVDLSSHFFENVEAAPAMVERTLAQHKEIVDLLKDGRFQEAGEVCFKHIEDVSENIVEKSKQQSLLISRRI
jgi:DNA-binding FadR family transcriptional regulator